jgi:hypothetical protein
MALNPTSENSTESRPSKTGLHHTITKDIPGPIDGGHFGYGASIDIDFDQSPTLQLAFSQIASQAQHLDEAGILTLVETTADELFVTRDERSVDNLRDKLRREKGAATLEDFAVANTGFCSQSAAFEALMLERLVQNGQLKGQPTISGFDVETADYSGGHTYCKYVSGTNSYILDAMSGYAGPEDQYAQVREEIEWQIKRDLGN